MIPPSVRWRLPISYAANALLAALALSGLLLALLRGYYLRQESTYLSSNARAMGAVLGELVAMDPPQILLQYQANSFAVLSQARVRVFDTERQLLADSGSMAGTQGVFVFDWDLSAVPATLRLTPHVGGEALGQSVSDGVTPLLPAETAIEDPDTSGANDVGANRPGATGFMYATSTVGTPFGFGLEAGATSDAERSDRRVETAFQDENGLVRGTVELSEGPAYGRQILVSVLIASLIASLAAILIAAVVGWWMSRQIVLPLLELTAVTRRMSGGELSARASQERADELGLLARSFNAMADRLQANVEALRRFAGDASHELQTPLTALRTYLELAPQDSFVQQAQDQARRLWTLAQALLDLSQLEGQGSSRVPTPVDLVAILRPLVESYASKAEQAGLGFSAQVPEGPLLVPGDAEQIRRAAANLLDNAVKFTPAGGNVRLVLEASAMQAILWVEDDGMGIPEEDLPHLTGRFRRGRNVSGLPGNGLGLAITKAIADNHDASLTFESEEGLGTRVRLAFKATR